MKLKVLLPTEVVLDVEVNKIVAEAENGSFCLLPRHIDFATALVPGLLSYTDLSGEERFLAVDEGVLVKCGSEVTISTRNVSQGAELGSLKQAVEQQFRTLDERERQTRSALAKLESSFIRRLLDVEA